VQSACYLYLIAGVAAAAGLPLLLMLLKPFRGFFLVNYDKSDVMARDYPA